MIVRCCSFNCYQKRRCLLDCAMPNSCDMTGSLPKKATLKGSLSELKRLYYLTKISLQGEKPFLQNPMRVDRTHAFHADVNGVVRVAEI